MRDLYSETERLIFWNNDRFALSNTDRLTFWNNDRHLQLYSETVRMRYIQNSERSVFRNSRTRRPFWIVTCLYYETVRLPFWNNKNFIFWNSERLTSVRDLHSETVRERFTFWNDDRFIFWNSETETHCKQCEICILKQRDRLKFWNNETDLYSERMRLRHILNS